MLDQETHRRIRDLAQLSVAEQAQGIRAWMREGMEPDAAEQLQRSIGSVPFAQAWDEAGRAGSAWARGCDWLATAISPAMRRISGLDTMRREGIPAFARLREPTMGLVSLLERPITRIYQRSRELQAEHTAALQAELGDDTLAFLQTARQGRIEQVEAHAGAMERQTSSEAVRQRFEAMTQPGDSPVIEAGIMPIVAAMNAWGIETSQSCEGHLDWGAPAPWVMFKRANAGKMQRLLDEAGGGSFVMRGSGRETMRLVMRGVAEDRKDMAPVERERHAQDLVQWQREAGELGARIDALPDRLAPAVELEGMDELGQAGDLDAGVELDQRAPGDLR
jgi:hypothetical protein